MSDLKSWHNSLPAEKTDEWPRVHTCLHNWCSEKNPECAKCDAIVAVIAEQEAAMKLLKKHNARNNTKPQAL